jgi:phenylalanyl-tRNA synthetase beta chain
MKISLEWLHSYLPGSLDAQAAGEALTNGGLPVEVFEKHGDDDVIDVEVTSNRGDCLSHVGVARELAALLDRPFQDVHPNAKESPTSASAATSVRIDAADLCPHYTARIIRNVKIGPSPAWMVRRLEAVGLRSINNVVDVMNYVMFEMGQPLHAFDFDKLAGRQIVVRRGQAGEKIISLDGKTHTLSPEMLVIADAQKAVALAGIMGGLESEVSAGTTSILLESARFEPLVVRKTARALAMKSDSSYRFERGIDPTLPERASLRAAQLILETAGGELLAGVVQAGASGHTPKKLSLRLSKLKRVLGIDIPAYETVAALNRLQFSPQIAGDRIDVTVPHWRLDINIEVDLVEEVARIVGYGRIPVRDEIAVRLQPADPAAKAIGAIRDTLVAGGYFEAVTFSFVSDLLAEDFKPADAAAPPRADAAVRKADAKLRPSILPGLLEALSRNENNGNLGAKLYEIGSTFWTDGAGTIEERRRVGLVGSSDLREVRGVVEELLGRLDADREMRVVPDRRAGYAAGACGRIEWRGEAVGWIGKIDRAVAGKLSLRDLPAAAELDLGPLIAGTQHVPQLKALPKFPAVWRDLSLVMAESVRYEQLDSLVRSLKLEHLEELEYVTTYRGKPLEKGTKSLTIKLHFRSAEKTLTGEEVEGAVKRIVEAATAQLGATLRA